MSQKKTPKQTRKKPTPNGDIQANGVVSDSIIIRLVVLFVYIFF